jgi:hypothetical protein
MVRIFKAAAQAGVEVRVKIDTAGNMLIAAGKGASGGLDINEWDAELCDGNDQA